MLLIMQVDVALNGELVGSAAIAATIWKVQYQQCISAIATLLAEGERFDNVVNAVTYSCPHRANGSLLSNGGC